MIVVRRGAQWLRRRGEHVVTLAVVDANRSLQRRAPSVTARALRRTGALLAPPLRSATGLDSVVVAPSKLRAALAAPLARAEGAAAAEVPELRVPYAPSMDRLAPGSVLAEDRPRVRQGRRAVTEQVLATSAEAWAEARAAAHEVAVSAVSGGSGRLDAVSELIVPACARAATRYLGIGDEHSERVFTQAQLVLHQIFLNPVSPKGKADWQLREASRLAGAALLETLKEKSVPESRFIQGDPDSLALALMVVISVGPHTAWAGAQALDELLRHPSALDHAVGWGTPVPADPSAAIQDRRGAAVLEAIRLLPPTSGVVRLRPSASDAPDPAPRGRAGEGVVFAWARTADFDREQVERPLAFEPVRSDPPGAAFGVGAHRCPGSSLAVQLLVTILDPLLSARHVRRTPGRHGLLRKVAPWAPLRGRPWRFPTGLAVDYESGLVAR